MELTEVESLHCKAWDKVGRSLQQYGIALVALDKMPEELQSDAAKSWFPTSRLAFDRVHQQPSCCRSIDTSISSAHVVGYHSAGGMSQRYNEFREGFVWSDGQTFEVEGLGEFKRRGLDMEKWLHALASSSLRSVEACIDLEPGWLEEHLGPTENSSQWHTKRSANKALVPDTSWLPSHTDPSLVSVVIHDLPGVTGGGYGFQFLYEGTWHPIQASGHAVAIIIVGSVLQYVTNGRFVACRHRVQIPEGTQQPYQQRLAATYFLRPLTTAVLACPSALPMPRKAPVTFERWLQKTARNYEKSRRKIS